MFGYVTASLSELTEAEKTRYNAVYCGICRRIRIQSSRLARLGVSYDMAFLALLLMSLYEPEEEAGERACALHPLKPKPWVDNVFIRYAADMNVALACYNFRDDWQDDRNLGAKLLADAFGKHLTDMEETYPRQCAAIREGIHRLNALEAEGCPNPDLPAEAFGDLMAELLVWEEDLWAPTLRRLGQSLGRFIYLLDAAVDYDKDKKKGKYNPYLAMGMEKDWPRWEAYLVNTMGAAAKNFEMLPLVQDKGLLDNILYSGVWVKGRGNGKKEKQA